MNAVVDRLITERRADPQALATKQDLLNYMLTGIDKQTGERLDDVNIRYQIVTFLIAGHETTSGLLSFAVHFLMKNPEALCGPTRRLTACSTPTPMSPRRATPRSSVWSTCSRSSRSRFASGRRPRGSRSILGEDTTLGGRFAVRKGENITVLLPMLHRDPSVWGDNPEEFDPSRFEPDRERQLPANSYKPFGNGQRACIGQQFAMQEATLVLGMILHRFELIDHANYQLRVKETLTLKPDGLTMKVRPRGRRARATPAAARVAVSAAQEATEAAVPPAGRGTPLLVLYGSNLGTAEGLAERIAEDGRGQGFSAKVEPLDDHVGDLPLAGAVIVVTSSYNGAPPDNAIRFCEWLQKGRARLAQRGALCRLRLR